MYIKIETLPPVEVDMEEIKKGTFDLEIDSGLRVQISSDKPGKKGGNWKVANAVNGYGQNVADQYKGKFVIFLDDINDPLNPCVHY